MTLADPAAKKSRPPRRPVLAQATHTASEELVYRTLFNHPQKRRDTQIVAISYTALAIATGRDLRTVQRAIRGLIRKESIQLIARGQSRAPAQYRVRSYTAILRNREQSLTTREANVCVPPEMLRQGRGAAEGENGSGMSYGQDAPTQKSSSSAPNVLIAVRADSPKGAYRVKSKAAGIHNVMQMQ